MPAQPLQFASGIKAKSESHTVTVERKGLLAFFPRAPLATLAPVVSGLLLENTAARGGTKRPREPEHDGEHEAPDYLQTLRKRIMWRMAQSGAKGPGSPVTPPSGSGAKTAESGLQHSVASPPRQPPPLPPTAASWQDAASANSGLAARFGPAAGRCSACEAPSRFCVCKAADRDDDTPVAPPPQAPLATATKPAPATDPASARPAWVCNSGGLAPPSEAEAALRRQMHILLLKIVKQGIWLTSHGNKKGMRSACITRYCRTTLEFNADHVAAVMDLARSGRSWGGTMGTFQASPRYTEMDSYQWKNFMEKALLEDPSLSRPSYGAEATTGGGSSLVATCLRTGGGGGSIVGGLTNGEVVMGMALAGFHPSFGPKSRREVNARFKASLKPL